MWHENIFFVNITFIVSQHNDYTDTTYKHAKLAI